MAEHRTDTLLKVVDFPVADQRLAARDSALARFSSELDTVLTKFEATKRQASRQAQEAAELTRHCRDLKAELAQCREDRDALLASTSWRITGPLRSLTTLLRKVVSNS